MSKLLRTEVTSTVRGTKNVEVKWSRPSRPGRIHIHGNLARTVDWELYDQREEREARRYSDEEVLVSLTRDNALALHGLLHTTLTSPLLSPAGSATSSNYSTSPPSSSMSSSRSPSSSQSSSTTGGAAAPSLSNTQR